MCSSDETPGGSAWRANQAALLRSRANVRSCCMIKAELISANALRITAPDKLHADDFRHIAPQIDSLIRQYGTIRLLIDATGFHGWENIAAFENHAGFVKT